MVNACSSIHASGQFWRVCRDDQVPRAFSNCVLSAHPQLVVSQFVVGRRPSAAGGNGDVVLMLKHSDWYLMF